MSEPYVLSFSVAYLPPMNTAATRLHFMQAAKRARREREMVVALVGKKKPPKPLERARITLVRLSSVEPDDENLRMSFKGIVDALMVSEWRQTKTGPRWVQRADVIVDDGPEHLVRDYRWEKVAPKRGMIGVRVEEIEVSGA